MWTFHQNMEVVRVVAESGDEVIRWCWSLTPATSGTCSATAKLIDLCANRADY